MPKPVRRVHDKLIQILREQVNDSTTLNLIRKYLKAGAMEFIISPDLLENKIKDGAGLLNPLNYYLRKVGM